MKTYKQFSEEAQVNEGFVAPLIGGALSGAAHLLTRAAGKGLETAGKAGMAALRKGKNLLKDRGKMKSDEPQPTEISGLPRAS